MASRDSILFVRVEPDLVAKLDRLAREERKKRMGAVISRSEIVRLILWEAVNERSRERAQTREEAGE